MATLVQRIALDGGKDIEDELKKLGADGEAAFKKLKDAADATAASGSNLNKFFTSIRAQFVAIGTAASKVKKSFDDIGEAARGVGEKLAAVATGEAAVVAGFFELAKSAAEAADAQGKAAQAAGLSIDQYGKLAFAFGQGEVSSEQLGVALKTLNKNIAGAASGSSASAAAFAKLGVTVSDGGGRLRDTNAILLDVADAFKRLPDGAEKAALAVQLFGRAGTVMIHTLDEGSKGIDELGARAEALGVTFSKADAQIGEDFNDSLRAMGAAVAGLKNQIGLLIVPEFTAGFKGITQLIADNKDAILDFAKTVASQVGPLIKDAFAILEGKDGDVANKNLLGIRDTIVSIGTAFTIVSQIFVAAFQVLSDTVQPLLDIVNSIFGTKFTGATALATAAVLYFLGAFRLVGALFKGGVAVIDLVTVTFGKLAGQLTGVATGILALIGGINSLTQQLGDWIDQVTGLDKVWSALGDTWNTIFGQSQQKDAQDTAKAIDQVATSTDGVSTAAKAAGPNLDNLAHFADAVTESTATLDQAVNSPSFLNIGFSAKTAEQNFDDIASAADTTRASIFQLADGTGRYMAVVTNASGGGVRLISANFDALAQTLIAKGISFNIAYANLGDTIVHTLGDIPTAVESAVSSSAGAIAASVTDAGTAVTTSTASTVQSLVSEWSSGLQQVLEQVQAFGGFLQQVWQGVVQNIQQVTQYLVTGFNSAIGAIENAFGGLLDFFGKLWQGILDKAKDVFNQIAALARAATGGGGSSDSTESHATGGHIRGKGTGTSDSIYARLSNGEFVVRAKAVAKYGVATFSALNRMSLPAFAAGGLVSRSVVVPGLPVMAGNNSQRPFNLTIGGEVFEGLLAPDAIANKLVRFATKKSQQSGGIKPTWLR